MKKSDLFKGEERGRRGKGGRKEKRRRKVGRDATGGGLVVRV